MYNDISYHQTNFKQIFMYRHIYLSKSSFRNQKQENIPLKILVYVLKNN